MGDEFKVDNADRPISSSLVPSFRKWSKSKNHVDPTEWLMHSSWAAVNVGCQQVQLLPSPENCAMSEEATLTQWGIKLSGASLTPQESPQLMVKTYVGIKKPTRLPPGGNSCSKKLTGSGGRYSSSQTLLFFSLLWPSCPSLPLKGTPFYKSLAQESLFQNQLSRNGPQLQSVLK